MTTFEVDLDEVRATLASLSACQRDLISLAGDIEAAQSRLQADWSGRAADAQATSYDTWRGGCADMVTALAGLRAVASAADAHYARAVESNLDLWRQVAP